MNREVQLDDLYREIILDHFRKPRNTGELDSPNVTADGMNPLCGDEVTVQINLNEGRIDDIRFHGRGCSISQASGSMMTAAIKGRTRAEALSLLEAFKRMMTDADQEPPEDLGDLEALQGVAKFPVRVKCATLAWHVLEEGLQKAAAA